MKILVESKGSDKQHSLWYHEERTIAVRKINGQKIVLEVVGEVRAMSEVNGVWFKGNNLVTELENTNRASDSSIQELYDDDLIDMMDWFQITNDTTGDEIIIDIDTYDEGIEALKQLTSEDI